jgi:hypothetical protein
VFRQLMLAWISMARMVRTDILMDQLVPSSIRRLTASAANTIVQVHLNRVALAVPGRLGQQVVLGHPE